LFNIYSRIYTTYLQDVKAAECGDYGTAECVRNVYSRAAGRHRRAGFAARLRTRDVTRGGNIVRLEARRGLNAKCVLVDAVFGIKVGMRSV